MNEIEPRKKEEKKGGAPIWLTSYSDLVTLMLTFFILLLSMATFETAKIKQAISSFQEALGVMPSMVTVAVMPEVFVPRLGGEQQRRKLAIKEAQDIVKKAEEQQLQEAIKVKVTETGIAIKLSDPQSFISGSAELTPQVRQSLSIVAESVRHLPNDPDIRVEGHTDNIPIHNALYRSNWHLSAGRALSVVEFLSVNANVPPRRLSALGYGEFRPLADNFTAEGREKNRRIEIYIDFIQKKEGDMDNYWGEKE